MTTGYREAVGIRYTCPVILHSSVSIHIKRHALTTQFKYVKSEDTSMHIRHCSKIVVLLLEFNCRIQSWLAVG